MNIEDFDVILKNKIKEDYFTFREKVICCVEENTSEYIEKYLKNITYDILLKIINEEEALNIINFIDFSKFIDLEKEKQNYIDDLLDEYNNGFLSDEGLKKILNKIYY